MTTLSPSRFHALWLALGGVGPSDQVFERLRDAYAEPHRAYHDTSHLVACLALCDEVKANAEVEAALWFHDAIYDTHASDNEDKSAELATTLLAGVASDRVARIADHIRATKTHRTETGDGQLVLDIDLSILGSDRDVYEAFETKVRREYAWVPEEAFRAGRAAVLRSFLERPLIYFGPWFRERFEAHARENLAWALARLS